MRARPNENIPLPVGFIQYHLQVQGPQGWKTLLTTDMVGDLDVLYRAVEKEEGRELTTAERKRIRAMRQQFIHQVVKVKTYNHTLPWTACILTSRTQYALQGRWVPRMRRWYGELDWYRFESLEVGDEFILEKGEDGTWLRKVGPNSAEYLGYLQKNVALYGTSAEGSDVIHLSPRQEVRGPHLDMMEQ